MPYYDDEDAFLYLQPQDLVDIYKSIVDEVEPLLNDDKTLQEAKIKILTDILKEGVMKRLYKKSNEVFEEIEKKRKEEETKKKKQQALLKKKVAEKIKKENINLADVELIEEDYDY